MKFRTFLMAGLLAFLAGTLVFSPRASAQEPGKELLKATGKLTGDDPADTLIKKSKSKVHEFKMEADKAYRIDLRSSDFDSFLRLEDGDKKQLGFDDDGGGFPNSRLVYLAKNAGTYRIIVTAFDGKLGEYTLTVTAANKSDLLQAKAAQFSLLSPKERTEVLTELKKHFADNIKDLGPKDAQLVMSMAVKLEKSDPDTAAKIYQDFGKLLASATDEKVANMSKRFEGCARRVKLVGNPIMVKGKKLDGKPLDWASYKGKVVLVDFWATWCGPCVAEMPNIKKAYEKYHDKGFEVVGISLDSDAAKPAKFMEDRKLPWVSIFDEKGADSLADYYGILFIPQAILVDRDGKVVSMNARGPELERLLEKMIGAGEKDRREK